MLNNINIGRYFPKKSKVHDMHPVAKVISIILFVILSMFVNDIKLNLVISIIVLLVIGLTHIPLKLYFKTIFGLKTLIIFIILINYFLGMQLIDIALIVIRLISLVLYTSILTFTTEPRAIAYSLEVIFAPLKLIGVPISKMALSISLAFRFIPTIIDQSKRILKALASRGVDYAHAGLKGKIRALKSLLLPLFILSFKRADTIANAMEVKLFDINKKRTHFNSRWHLFDTYIVMMHLLILLVVLAKELI